jgi:hypothetical protein
MAGPYRSPLDERDRHPSVTGCLSDQLPSCRVAESSPRGGIERRGEAAAALPSAAARRRAKTLDRRPHQPMSRYPRLDSLRRPPVDPLHPPPPMRCTTALDALHHRPRCAAPTAPRFAAPAAAQRALRCGARAGAPSREDHRAAPPPTVEDAARWSTSFLPAGSHDFSPGPAGRDGLGAATCVLDLRVLRARGTEGPPYGRRPIRLRAGRASLSESDPPPHHVGAAHLDGVTHGGQSRSDACR